MISYPGEKWEYKIKQLLEIAEFFCACKDPVAYIALSVNKKPP